MAPKGGFDYVTYNRRLASVKVPDKIKCKVCKKIRGQSAFSKRQLEELRKGMLKTGCTGITGQNYAGCMTCISGQVFELTCNVCDKTMALEYFSKNQRHDPDNARCKNCVQEHLEKVPVSEDLSGTIEDGTGYALSTIFIQGRRGDFSIPSSDGHSIAQNQYLQEGSVTQTSNPENSNGFDSDEDALSVAGGTGDGGVWLERLWRRPLTETSYEGAGTRFTAFDPQGNPHIRFASAPSVAPTVHSELEGCSVVTESRASSNPASARDRGRRGGFAKAPGVRFPKSEAPTMCCPQPIAATIESDDDDEDEDPQKYV
ncbi:hypothetical protein ACJ73_04317 [Blastomyces percursus]|uniref:Stc1 domain-containing protein n=1 Tax=Blastomyces percursus TaxID=1658174 RepID=A0A1J9Q703_9EURO|nr:hypothetical protein ACJ73_04317 [Blastomyces percursus]